MGASGAGKAENWVYYNSVIIAIGMAFLVLHLCRAPSFPTISILETATKTPEKLAHKFLFMYLCTVIKKPMYN